MKQFSPPRLRSARQEAGLRPEHLAVAVDRCTESIRGYELGRIDPPASLVAAMAAAMGIDPGDLFIDADDHQAAA